MSNLNKSRRAWLDALLSTGSTRFDVESADAVASATGRSCIPLWFRANSCEFKVARGQWDISSYVNGGEPVEVAAPVTPAPAVESAQSVPTQSAAPVMLMAGAESRIVPEKMAGYVKWGHHKSVATIIASSEFYPVYVTGLSGNGKTTMIMQAAADANREIYRVNITRQTDEDDLILQPLLEGNGIFVKKTGEYVVPAPGFNILATANTKGKGDETGSFAHTGIMNEAMLDRFPVTLEQPYADPKTETKILEGKASNFGVDAAAEKDFISDLVQWADNIRKTYMAGGMSEIVTTRRLESILKAFSIFGKHTTAIEMGISRFDEQTKSDMIRLYEKISGERTESNTQESEATDANDNPNAVPWN